MQIEGWMDLSGRAKFQLTGPDAERYLNGQTTNDVRKAVLDRVLPSLVTNAKGKIEAEVMISRLGPDSFLLDGPDELRMELQIRLDRYLIADNAELTDVTEEFRLVHLLGPTPAVPEGAQIRSANRFGVEGWDVLTPVGVDWNPPGEPLSEATREKIRIAHGIPSWSTELAPGVLPQEAALEDRCLDFYKGCYIGQEVISRIKSVGRVNRVLRLLVAAESSDELRPGETVWWEDQEVGRITSVAKNSELDRMMGLAYVKRDASVAGTWLRTECVEKTLSSRLEIRETPLCC